ncbi:hypothetical protein KP509_15G016100 [Ceratopteris richardii]|uniref:ADP-ribosyl cyclase/cyclic ADP-ribose hydrolase n=1 Tax=Ceratopteris richardii TaxID=49495 RepID=A0A8T2T3B5_CERRI|nr:hypothetical protein KP509_15G016100 [Ceratopteris richardii]
MCASQRRRLFIRKVSSSRQRTMMRRVYDVYISHRGPDSKRNIVSVLRGVLESKGIKCFVDYTMERGDQIFSTLAEAIKGSKVHIIILSPGFAESRWCLDEVLQILDTQGRSARCPMTSTVLPVYYDVQVHWILYNLRGMSRSTDEEIEAWAKALIDVSNIEGFHYDSQQTHTWQKVQDIVAKVEDMLAASREEYDVFICHAADTKRDFASILRGVLGSKRIKCLDQGVEAESDIMCCISDILKSRLHIVLLSPGFGRSRLCLDALVQIMNIEAPVRRVLPVFHDVTPCVVRYQSPGSEFDLSAVERNTPEDRERWSNALYQLSHLKGYEYDSQTTFQWPTIELIVKQVEIYLGDLI